MNDEHAFVGQPWEMAKAFDTSLALGEFIPKEKIPDPHKIVLKCKVNDELRQNVSDKPGFYYLVVFLRVF